MKWGPTLSSSQQAALVTQQAILADDEENYALAVEKVQKLLASLQAEVDAGKEVFEWLHNAATQYRYEWEQLTGGAYSQPFKVWELDEAVDPAIDSRLFPRGRTSFEPKTTIEALNLIPNEANWINYRTEASLAPFLTALLESIFNGLADPANVTNGITTNTPVTATSTSVTVSNTANFVINKWALLINSWSEEIAGAINIGQCLDPGGGANNRFVDATATWITDGAAPGDILQIYSGGANDGEYAITEVISETDIRTAESFPFVPSTNEDYYILRAQSNQRALVSIDAIPAPGAPGTLTITVKAITTPQVNSGATITSNLNAFRSESVTLGGLVLGSVLTQINALEANTDNVTFDADVFDYTNYYLTAARSFYNQLLAWLNSGDAEKIAGVDGDITNVAPYGRLTSAGSNFITAGVQINDTLRIYAGYALRGGTGNGRCGWGGAPANQFTDPGSNFLAAGFNVQAGDVLRISGGANAGDYDITDILDATNLLVSSYFPSTPTIGETYVILSADVQGDWPIQSIPLATAVNVYDQWEKVPASPAASLSFRVVYPAIWDAGVISEMLEHLGSRRDIRLSRVNDLTVRAPALYTRRSSWINLLVHRQHGSMVRLASTQSSLASLQASQSTLSSFSAELGGIL